MKKIVLLFLISFSCVVAQEKVTYKKKKFFIPKIVYPSYPVLDNVLTQTTFYQVSPNLTQMEQILKKNFFSIDGFIKDPSNGKLKIYITVPIPKFTKTKVDSAFNKKERVWVFNPYSEYNVKINVEVKYNNTLLYAQEINYFKKSLPIGNYQKEDVKLVVSTNDEKVNTAIDVNDLSENDHGIGLAVYNSMIDLQNVLNAKFGYNTTQTKDKFEFMTSKSHPEYTKMLAYENEITAQLQKVTLEKGLDEKLLMPHLIYLESLLTKYPPSEQNTDLRFMVTNNLAESYLLLENKEKALTFANLLIDNDQQESRGRAIINRANSGDFVSKTIRSHTNRFLDLKKLGYQIREELEEKRLAFFEKIDQQEADWEQEKNSRNTALQKTDVERNGILDSISYQRNPEILAKIIANLGGSQVLKSIQKTHILSKLKLEDSKIQQIEEKWTTNTNYLLKKKMPENFYEIVNGPESWSYDSRNNAVGEKWKKHSTSDYLNLATNLDPIYFLSAIRLDLWNKLELLEDQIVDGKLCYHLQYFEKTLNSSNRTIPKNDHNFFIDKEHFNLVCTEKTVFDNGNKSFFERKIFQDYREISTINNGKIPFKTLYEIEDFYGDTFYVELREKVEINPVFGNRIFMKEVYAGSFK